MEYQPIDHRASSTGREEWKFHFTRHGLDCSVTITSWPTGNWSWQSLIDARGRGAEPWPRRTGIDRLRHGHGGQGPPTVSPIAKIGGTFPDLSLSQTLEMALEQIDNYHLHGK